MATVTIRGRVAQVIRDLETLQVLGDQKSIIFLSQEDEKGEYWHIEIKLGTEKVLYDVLDTIYESFKEEFQDSIRAKRILWTACGEKENSFLCDIRKNLD